ncbi:MAG: DUF3189 family protein [Firmicutes bacterium]|nr:DUF3189 family protein [Bacillota bacterium]
MIIIYWCYGGAHSSPIAAAIHVGKLPADRTPTVEQIESTLYYDQVDSQYRGRTLYVGEDEFNNKVYVCGRGSEKKGIEQAIRSGVTLAGGKVEDFLFVDTLPAVNNIMRLGGFLSRQLKWVSIGRPIVIRGTQKAFPQLVEIVTRTKEKFAKDKRETASP